MAGDDAIQDPDVLVDVPQLHVDEISLEVQDLNARVSLEADVLQLLRLHVGIDATLGRVQLSIKGVEAQALLKVRLDNVARILDRVLTTIDDNPQIIERLVDSVGGAVEHVGAGAGSLAGDLGRAVEDLGGGVESAAEALAGHALAPAPAPPEDAERPRRRRKTEPTNGRARRTSTRARNGGAGAR
jgi:hypothetical protein